MNTSNKLLLGLLVTILLFVTVVLGTARVNAVERQPGEELVSPPEAIEVPEVPEAPAPPAAE